MSTPSYTLNARADHCERTGQYEKAGWLRETAEHITRMRSEKCIGRYTLELSCTDNKITRIVKIWLLWDNKIQANLWTSNNGRPYTRFEILEAKDLYYQDDYTTLSKVSELDEKQTEEFIQCIQSKLYDLHANKFNEETEKVQELIINKRLTWCNLI